MSLKKYILNFDGEEVTESFTLNSPSRLAKMELS
jgi:hypothetical protein